MPATSQVVKTVRVDRGRAQLHGDLRDHATPRAPTLQDPPAGAPRATSVTTATPVIDDHVGPAHDHVPQPGPGRLGGDQRVQRRQLTRGRRLHVRPRGSGPHPYTAPSAPALDNQIFDDHTSLRAGHAGVAADHARRERDAPLQRQRRARAAAGAAAGAYRARCRRHDAPRSSVPRSPMIAPLDRPRRAAGRLRRQGARRPAPRRSTAPAAPCSRSRPSSATAGCLAYVDIDGDGDRGHERAV